MVIFHTAPAFRRPGVMAGFVLGFSTGLAPTISKGVLFAQGTMWRPNYPDAVLAMPSAGLLWLLYNWTSGYYWWGSQYGATAGDALLGWAVNDGTNIIAVSVSRLGTGQAAVIPVGGGAVIIGEGDLANYPDAPNVTASSTTYALTQVGTVPYFRAVGTSATLPTSDPKYAHLRKLEVWLMDGAYPVGVVGTVSAPFAPDGSHNISWTGTAFAQASVAKAYTLEFRCSNEAGQVTTAGMHTETLNVPAAIPLAPPVTISTVTGSEVGPVTIDLSNQLPSTRIRATGTVSANAGNQVFSVWRSIDNGVNYVGVGVFPFSGTSFSTAAYGDISSLVPGASSSWKIAVAIGYAPSTYGMPIPAANLPANAVVSNSFTVAGIGPPSATGASGLAFSTPVYMGINSIGAPYWRSVLHGSLPGLADPYNWFTAITVECVDASGNSDPGPDLNTAPFAGTCNTAGTAVTWFSGERFNPSLTDGNLGITINGVHYAVATYTDSAHLVLATSAGTQTGVAFSATGGERLYGEFVNGPSGQIQALGGSSPTLDGNYNPAGSAYTRLRSKAYAVNRNTPVMPGWKDPSAVRQTTAWGGANQQVIVFGDAPTGTLRMDMADRNTLTAPLSLDPTTLKLTICNDLSGNMLANGDFSAGLDGWAASGGLSLYTGSGAYSPPSCGKTTGAYAGAVQLLPAKPGQRFRLSCMMKSDSGASGSYGYIYYCFRDAAGAEISGTATYNAGLPAPMAAWTAASLTTVAAPPNAVSLYAMYGWIANIGTLVGSWYVDAARCELVDGVSEGLVIDPVTGFPRSANNNPGVSILWNWDFSLSPVGPLTGAGWGASASVEIRDDGDGNGHYARLPGANENVVQKPSITGGQALNFAFRVRSNNPGGTHSVTMAVYWFDGSNVQIGSGVNVGTVSGSIPSWADGPSATLQAPAGAAYANIWIIVASGETAGGHWDIGKVLVQPVLNQNDGQSRSMIPGTDGAGNTAILSGVNGTYSVAISPRSIKIFHGTDAIMLTHETGDPDLKLSKGSHLFEVLIGSSNVNINITDSGGTSHNGYTGAIAGRSAICGIVV